MADFVFDDFVVEQNPFFGSSTIDYVPDGWYPINTKRSVVGRIINDKWIDYFCRDVDFFRKTSSDFHIRTPG